MTLNKHFTYGFEDRPEPKLWLCKPNKQRIERLASFTKLSGTFKYTNLNQLTFQLPLMEFNEETKQVERNKSIDMVKSKYLIEYRYNGFKDYLVIDDIKKTSNDSDYITIVADSLASELNKKSANDIELLGSTLTQMNNKIFEVYAPLWKLGYVDPKLADVKRELTSSNTTANALIDQICSLFDAVAIYNNIDRVVDYYHKDNVGTNRGLRVRENSYLKSFEDQFVSKDIVTRLYPFGNNGLTIQGVNPAGSSYIEDFSFFMAPFKRDINKNVIEHSAYMTDELCHALLDYQEFYNSKKDIAEEMTKSYSDILKEHSTEDFKLNQLSAILTRQRERVELLKPKSEYIDLGNKETDFEITTAKSSYYLLMLRNDGNLARIKFNNQEYDIKSGEWLYIKIDTGDFEDATKFENKLKYKLEMKSTNTNLRVVYTRSSLTDYEEEDTKVIEEKYNYEKYKKLVEDQEKIVASIEKRMKLMEDQKSSLITSMNPKSFLTDDLYKERELYVFESIWTEENHTEAKDLYEDAIKEMKKQKEINRTITVDLVNFVQSIDHQYDWDKLNVGDKIVFSNKMFGEKLKAYITELQLNFDDNGVKVVISDVFDYKDLDTIIAEKLAQTSSTASQVNFQKEQIKDQTGKMTKMTELIEAEWDANKRRIMAGNETVDIGSHGVKVTSKENPNEYVIMVGGVIAMTRDGGETFKTGITPEGINAEMLLGKMIVGETLTLENESGTMRFDKDGLFINASDFHLTSNDGKENYFDKLKREIQDNAKQETDRIVDSFRNEINQTISEATDVEKIVNDTTNILNDAFQDGVITNVEKKLIKDSLSTLEKENQEYQDEIDLALNHPYITPQDTIDLNEAIVEYESMYESLTTSIIESISDSKVTAEESEKVNQSIVDFREEVKEILSLTQTIIERTKDQQLKSEVEKAIDYSNRVKEDIKDEMDDLKKSFNGLNETIEEAMQDNIFDAAEIEAIKTVVLLAKSEYQDIENRYNTIKNDTKLPKAEKDKLVSNYTELNAKFLDFTKYIDAMIADGKSDDTEKTNYKAKYNALTNATTEFKKQYDASVIAISKQYTNDETGKILGSFDSLSNELKNDLKDVQDNIIEFKSTTVSAFQDGIVTEAERTRLRVQLDMLERESLDVEERYNSILNHQYANSEIKNSISVKRSPYISAHSNLRIIIERVIADGKVTTAEKTEANNAITTYNNTLTAYSKAIQEALNSMSKVIAADIAQTNVSQFSGVLSDISSSIQDIQKQADGAIDTYYLNGVPTLTNEPASAWTTTKVKESHLGDLYLNNKTGVAYRFLKENNTYVWKEIADQVISDALRQSKNAQDTADGKRRVFVNTPKPPYDTGDMWVQGTSGDILVCNISKETGGIYSSNDWIKASKYTDDTIANKALTDLNTFKTTANQDISSLKTKTSNFERDIVNAFDDKVISIAEASSIKGQLALLDHEKNRITQQYLTLINNSALEGSPKTNLTSTYSLMNTKMNNLTSSIQSSIADNKIVISESNDVSSKFSEYKVAVSNYEIAVNNAIIQKIATTSADAATARFEEWKRSEFSQSSEQIAQRVSGSTWSENYLPIVNQKTNSLKDYIQSRGTNLITNGTGLMSSNENFSGFEFDITKSYTGNGSFKVVGDNKTLFSDELIPVDPNRTYRFSYYALAQTGLGKHYSGVAFYDNDKLQISPYYVYGASKPLVKLAKDLKIGDTEIYLTSVDGFVDSDTNLSHKHSIVLYRYTDSFGHEYAPSTYSRYVFTNAWNIGDIDRVNKVIKLRKPFNVRNKLDSEGVFRKDHPVSATQSGGSYSYTAGNNVNYPTENWERFAGTIGGLSYAGIDKFWHGTNFVKLVFLVNRDTSGGQAGDISWHSNIVFEDITGTEAVKEELYTTKDFLNNELIDVKTSLNDFKTVTNGAFKDGIIASSEASVIASHIQLLNNEKSDINSKYTQLYNNSNLVGVFKTNLNSAKTTYDNAHTALINAINTAISDSKVTSTEKANVDVKFVEYRTNLESLSSRIEEATNSIAAKLSSDAEQNALLSANKYTDNIQVGTRNLLKDSNNYIKTSNYNINDYPLTIDIPEGTEVTVSLKATLGSDRQYFSVYNSGGLVRQVDLPASTQGRDGIYRSTFKWATVRSSTTASNTFLRLYHMTSSATSQSTVEWIKLEIGNKSTDWSPAPEDFDTKIENISIGGKNILKGTKDYDTNYWNGIFTEKFNKDGRTFVPLQNKTNTSGSQQWIHQTFKTDPYTDYIISFDAYKEGTAKGDIYPQMRKLKDDATDFNPFVSIFAYNEKNKSLTNNIVRYSIPFKSDECNYMRFYITRESTSSAPIYIANIQIEKGNKASDWSPNPDEIQDTLNQHTQTITANNAFIETNKDKILNSVSRTDVQAQLDKIATYETSYTVSNGANISARLAENNGNFFNDNYSYEVVAKNNSLSQDNIATAIFVSKGVGKGFELVELENISKTGAHPKFLIDKLNPSISLYDAQTATQNISVIYTKYLGKASAIKTAKSMIEQKADEINLEVKRLTAETDYNNMLVNSDFSSGWEGWLIQDSNYDIIDKSTFGLTLLDPVTNTNKSYNSIKMTYKNNISYPSVISNYMSVGKGQDVAIGETLTLSAYVYVPSSSKSNLAGNIYFEVAGYETKNQGSNPSIGRVTIPPEEFVYDKWIRYNVTFTIPQTTTNGKTNYIRALLRYNGSAQSINTKAIFYYALPQLEKGSKLTPWSLSRLDVFSTEQMASKIALNPESIDIITRNINFNTDTISIQNSNGNFLITGDTLTVSNNDNSNKTTINSNGISIKKDGVDKFINGLDLGSTNVQPTLPMAKTWNLVTGSAGNNSYNNKPVVSESPWGSFLLERDAYKYAIDNKQGEEASGTDKVNVAQFSYYHEKRYLRMDYQAAATEGNNFYITVVERPGWKTNSSIKVYQEIKVAGTKRGTVPIRSIYFDLGKPVYMFNTFYIQLAISGTTGLGQGAELQILRMSLTDYNN